jgi:hypothetical protein
MHVEQQAFRTSGAAAYLSQRGLPTSKSYLEKARARGPDDLRDRGPDFWRDVRSVCWYDRTSLDRYLAQRLAGRQFRAPAAQPLNFRRTA